MALVGDWLDDKHDASREAARVAALDFAKLYLIFTEGRGKQLLDYWEATLCRRKVAVDSSVQVYAAHNAVREFVEGIKQQIDLARSDDFRL